MYLWQARLDRPAAEVAELEALLAPAERARAERMATPDLRRRATVARGVLREVLAECVGGEAGQLRLEADRWGKPRLAAGTAADGLAFNLGHSGDVAVVAVAADRPVGVDVELLPRPDLDRPARRFLHPEELAAAPAGPDRDEWLLAAWVRKEASAKLDGRGLRRDLRRVRLEPLDAPDRWRGRDRDREEGRSWVVQDVRPAPDVLVAVAAEGEDWRLVARG